MVPPGERMLISYNEYTPKYEYAQYAQTFLLLHVEEKNKVPMLLRALPDDMVQEFYQMDFTGDILEEILGLVDTYAKEQPIDAMMKEYKQKFYTLTFSLTDNNPIMSFFSKIKEASKGFLPNTASEDIALFFTLYKMPRNVSDDYFTYLREKEKQPSLQSLREYSMSGNLLLKEKQMLANRGRKDKPLIQKDNKTSWKEIIEVIDYGIREMELDTGSGLNYFSSEKFKELNIQEPVDTTDVVNVSGYLSGQKLQTSGSFKVKLTVQGKVFQVKFNLSPAPYTILGFEELQRLSFLNIKKLNLTEKIDKYFEKHPQLSNDELWDPVVNVKLDMKDEFHPKVFPAKRIKPELYNKVVETLKREIQLGYYKKVKNPRQSSPVVIIEKPDKSLRVCGDYKWINSSVIIPEMKTLPSIKEILKHGRFSYMSSIDIKNEYKQFNLKEDDRWLTTISTPIRCL
uniref:Reverse transcriptase domain-containing protein n=1 Tax=Strongyloides venezuelensis TaxID=75913 RepID=A0A0K0EXW2_STRVS